MKKTLTIIVICILFIATGILSYTTYNLYQENQELQEDVDDLKEEIKKTSSNNNYSKDDNNINKEDNKTNEEDNEENNPKELEVYSNIEVINYSELTRKLLNDETFILFVSQTGCYHCESYRPTLNSVLKDNNITAYEIDLRKLTQEEYKNFNDFAHVSGTPTTIFIKDGDEVDASNRLIGSVQSENIISSLKSLGYIK